VHDNASLTYRWYSYQGYESASTLVPQSAAEVMGVESADMWEEIGIVYGPLLPDICRFESNLPFVVLCVRACGTLCVPGWSDHHGSTKGLALLPGWEEVRWLL
jgi:hypothetical protein